MADFRFSGVVPSGKIIQGNLTAATAAEARKKIIELSKGRPFKIERLERRATYLYKVQKGTDKPILGEQKAFSREEVEVGLRNIGYNVLYVRKKWLDFRVKPPTADIVTFVRLSADLLREKLPYSEVLALLSNDVENANLKETLKDINNDLRQGKESERVFLKYQHVLGKFTAHMLGLASKSGSMVELYESTAKFLERRQEFKKSLKSAMLMPMITLVLLFGACIFYVGYIFPETARMFLKHGIELPPMTAATLKFSDWLVANIAWVIIAHIAVFAAGVAFYMSEKGRLWVDEHILKVPVLGSLIHKTLIEIFCRVFYSLYSGSGENIDVIKIASEATGNRYFDKQVRAVSIPMMLQQGKGLHESLEASGVFTKTSLSRFHAGAETGTVRATALQLANYYERETTYKMKAVIEYVQLAVAFIIMIVMTAITIVSSETAVVKPKSTPGFKSEVEYLFILLPFVKGKVSAWIRQIRSRENS